MSCDQFSLLLRFFHLNDNTKYIPKGQPGYDPLYKLRPLVDPLIANFKAAFNSGHEVAVDEGMIGFKGQLRFLQYMPNKPTKWGMKIYSDSVTGYTYNWKLYTGMNKSVHLKSISPPKMLCSSHNLYPVIQERTPHLMTAVVLHIVLS